MGHTNHGDLELAQPAASDGGGLLEELCTAQPHLSLLAREARLGLGFGRLHCLVLHVPKS